jgi:hypothetical protein
VPPHFGHLDHLAVWLDRNNFSGTQRARMRNKKLSIGLPSVYVPSCRVCGERFNNWDFVILQTCQNMALR